MEILGQLRSDHYYDSMSQFSELRKLEVELEEWTTVPRLLCPECGNGYIRFDSPTEAENGLSERMRLYEEAWEPDWINGTFTSMGTCENPECGSKIAASGTYRVDTVTPHSGDGSYEDLYSSYYKFKSFIPPLLLIQIPESAPELIREGIARASAVLFADPSLAATALRLVIEQFLTSEDIPEENSSGHFINLHERIEKWRDKPNQNRVAELFLAVKWIGNAGTHSPTRLSFTEVLEGAEILEEAFHTLFLSPDIDARAQAISYAKGPHKSPDI